VSKPRISRSDMDAALGHKRVARLLLVGQSGAVGGFILGGLIQLLWEESGDLIRILLLLASAVCIALLVIPIAILIRARRKLRRSSREGRD
jgi:nitrate/nitrite transporter NarK